jgi:hypothetical protein
MPSRRWPLLLIPLLLTACKDRALEERTEQIREYSDKEDRVNSAEAIHQIEHQFWTLLPSRAFYSGWHLQLTISSDTWRTYPPSTPDHPFRAVYAITRHGPTNWQIDVTAGPTTTRLHREDLPTIDLSANSPIP